MSAWDWARKRYLDPLALGAHDWRPRLVLATLACVELLVVVLATVYLAAGDRAGALVMALLGLAGLGLLELNRHVTRARASTVALVTTAASILAIIWFEPALDSGMLLWLGILPVVASLFIGSHAGARWLAVSSVLAVGAWVLKGPPAEPPAGLLHTFRWGSFVFTSFVFMVLFDLSRRRALEAAQAASRAKSAFLATMSHEIRTPMNGVLGMAEVMLHDDPRPEQREQLLIIQRSGQALIALINDILDLSKVEASKLSLDGQPFQLSELLAELAHLHATLASRRGLALHLEVAADVPARVVGDALRLRQVLGNLLGNAVKFTEQGRVDLRVRRGEGDRVHFAVTDTGVGLSPESLGKLFEPFQQVDSSPTRRFEGTGLGLALARQLVRLLGGELTVTSKAGAGSTFAFDAPLPEAAPAPPAPRPSAPSPLPGGARKVLVVDDNAVNRTVAASLVRKLGFAVELAQDGAEAVTAVEGQAFALVLMDCHMPGEDGFTATARIRALPGVEARVPIVALTASAMPEELESCRRAGMDDCLTKPVGLAQLKEVLDRFAGPGELATAPPPAQRAPGA
jgi:signal transduction histidine kinase/CheY-like chemotaxis protein